VNLISTNETKPTAEMEIRVQTKYCPPTKKKP
jgi:hypothetical protein